MERPNLGQQPPSTPAQADFVHLVFPLRIIAPPGTESRVPHPLAAYNAFNAFCLSQKQHRFEARSCGDSKNGAAEGPKSRRNGGCSSRNAEIPEASKQSAPQGQYKPKPKVEVNPSAKPARPAPVQDYGGIPPRQAVINLLRLYHGLCRNMMYEEEIKVRDSGRHNSSKLLRNSAGNGVNAENSAGKNQEEGTGKEASVKGNHYLKAGAIINRRGMGLNRDNSAKVVGSVAGVEVGDHFYFRMELCCIGMHTFPQGGIDYTSSKSGQCEVSIATSIISSGSYNNTDDGEVLIYTGQGGRSAQDRKPTEDQKMERGNLALENSMKRNVPIRVIRGVKDAASPTCKIYTYDGLYMIESCWSEKGKSGFGEFKFKLRRLPGQPTLGSALLKLSNTLDVSQREGLRVADLSAGKEGKPICVVNTVDNTASPSAFEYLTTLRVSDGASSLLGGYSQGCSCVGECTADRSCACFATNGNTFAYLQTGTLVKERGLIHECGIDCKCSASCRNRSTQRSLMYRLEVFKTEQRGWGLRSWDSIPAGSFICEYAGMLMDSPHLLHTRDYALNVSSLPSQSPPWGHVSEYLENPCNNGCGDASSSKPNLLIDASHMGNAARFINHSCSPNVLVQCVLRNYTRCPVAMLFAMDNIPPFTELTIDYGCDSSILTRKNCLCKSAGCKGTFCG